ncbi:RES domain-containing protein [Polynucleobacter kasalickyi]|uniref:RES domain-containing protein n=1 Tax=Polynucleobacter kasalickyi TaxID=1938817 RepID=A0A1W2AMX3_9BURK|nr:RES domain-containing protein [Polynucleobacter kasalickyi]SMC62036.1 RES domain-containing protein [Polynucleobacter kasalickyi]
MAGQKPIISPKVKRASKIKKPPIKDMGKEVADLLEQGSLTNLQKAKQLSQDYLKHQWDFYSELAFQRNTIAEELIDSISESCIEDYQFESWQRALTWKYTNHPLCTIGSLKQYGGRFNIGENISPSSALKTFSAFYIAEDQPTARAEAFGSPRVGSSLTPEEISLTNKRSYACISISGSLDKVFDLTKKSSLTKFVRLISKFKIPKPIYESATRLNLPTPTLINSSTLLMESLLASDWRKEPAQADIPANGQIFGQMAHKAGVDGILFKSSKTRKLCLAIYPSNFANGNSYIQLDDEPPEKWIVKKIDSGNFKLCEKNADEIQLKGTLNL